MQPALPGANAGNQLGSNGLQLTAKRSLTLPCIRKRNGNGSFGSPVGHSHFSISQQLSPTCLPILSNPVKLITKRLQQRPKTLTANTSLVWLTILLILLQWQHEGLLRRLLVLITLLEKAADPFPHQWVLQYLLHCYLMLPGQGAGSSPIQLHVENCLQAKNSAYKSQVTSLTL